MRLLASRAKKYAVADAYTEQQVYVFPAMGFPTQPPV